MASKMKLLTWIGRKDMILSHMAKKNWLKDEDQTSKFFLAILNAKEHNRVTEM